MKRAIRVIGIAAGILIVVLAAGLGYLLLRFPDAGPTPSITVNATPERLARGKYLVTHVTVCIDCHSERDWKQFSGPVVPGTEGKGGERFDANIGLPGVVYAKNITPAALGKVSDGLVLRAVAGGIDHNGKPLFPLMGYSAYAQLSKEDLYSIIAYIRTLKPIENAVPEHLLDFPMNLIVRTIPAPFSLNGEPNTSSSYEYGKYLVNAAGCIHCHSQQVKGEILKGMEFAGGWVVQLPDGVVRSANITPDEETGIGLWDKGIFIAKFKEWENADSTKLNLQNMGRQSIMPWTLFAGMTESDLGAIYDFLRTVHPVKNKVETWSPAAVAQR